MSISEAEITIEVYKAELADAEALIESVSQGYDSLRTACEQILRARDVAIQRGERLNLTTVYQWIELALTQAEVVQSIGLPSQIDGQCKTYCTVCNSLWTDEDDRYGKCLTCERSGLTG